MNWTTLKQHFRLTQQKQVYNNLKFIRVANLQKKYELKKQKFNHDDFYHFIFPNNMKYRFIQNDFPYRLDKHIKHSLLFLNPNYYDKIPITMNREEYKFVKENLNNEFVYFINDPKLRSIMDFPHYHVFSRTLWKFGCIIGTPGNICIVGTPGNIKN